MGCGSSNSTGDAPVPQALPSSPRGEQNSPPKQANNQSQAQTTKK